ncbi:TetR family transcriptional regulator [Kitasatospora sp. NPDC058218]|uniref:TetR family transcriptional regulator n=1 Tax=Kitasatospora sp. NPDC058218 TaxID=3346385 RepID=UPI0036D97203
MKQERAQHTRRALLRAAAGEFDRHGYAGTSLSRVSRAAGVTMGALTFHFPTKASLADAVRADAVELTRAAVGAPAGGVPAGGGGEGCGVPGPGGGPGEVARLTDVLTRLLQEEPSVSAAARLAWEQPGAADNWYASWIPVLRGHLAGQPPCVPAQRDDGPDPDAHGPEGPDGHGPAGQAPGEWGTRASAAADAQDLELLVHCLVVGSEALRRGVVPVGGETAPSGDELRQRLRRLWHRTLAGPSA